MSDTLNSALDPATVALQRELRTSRGTITYLDSGPGPAEAPLPPALFVHGVVTSSLIWRNAIPLLAGRRRCIAVDLPMHGGTRTPIAPDFSLNEMADFLADFCDELQLNADGGRIDLVANDTGGAIAQVFAVRHPERLRSLTLTDCDTVGNLPPKAFAPTVLFARKGLLLPMARLLARLPRMARRVLLTGTYEHSSRVPLPVVDAWSRGLLAPGDNGKSLQHWLGGMNDRELVEIDPALRRLTVPTLLVWGTRDRFFGLKWAHRLQDTLAGPVELVTIPGGRLFLVDERAGEFADAVAIHWDTTTRRRETVSA